METDMERMEAGAHERMEEENEEANVSASTM